MAVSLLKPGAAPVEVGFEPIRSPLGTLTVIESARGLLAVECGRMTAREVRQFAGARATGVPAADAKLPSAEQREVAVTAQLREFFDGKRRVFSVALDLFGVTAFRTRVYRELVQVPFGALSTYGELAAGIGKPRAAQAVGGAVGANPWLILVPCHRVIAGDGSLGGFSSGLERKRQLLSREGIVPPAGGWPGRAG